MNDKSVGDIEYTLKHIWSAEVFDMDNNAVVKTCIMSKTTLTWSRIHCKVSIINIEDI